MIERPSARDIAISYARYLLSVVFLKDAESGEYWARCPACHLISTSSVVTVEQAETLLLEHVTASHEPHVLKCVRQTIRKAAETPAVVVHSRHNIPPFARGQWQ